LPAQIMLANSLTIWRRGYSRIGDADDSKKDGFHSY